MREPAATPITRGKTERPLEEHFPLSPSGSSTDARAARDALDALLADDPPALPDGFGTSVERYVELLLEANRRLNLTRIVEPAAIARLHLLDALTALRWIDAWTPGRAVDLGSGGGVPGIVLAIARPEVEWILVDSVGKKVAAMQGFVAELGLPNVAVVAARAEEVGRLPEHREASNLVVARALAALPVLCEYALPLLAVGGHLLAWKGRMAGEELSAGGIASATLGGAIPTVEPAGPEALADHRFVVVEKVRPTPTGYPRRPGEPSRRPLG
jgi:16S rRNA (guanine527-N7)-methyltransferase